MDINDKVLEGIKDVPMRDVLHKTTAVLHGRGKVITLREHAEEKECVTDVRKNFIYVSSEAQAKKNSQPLKYMLRNLLIVPAMMKNFLSG